MLDEWKEQREKRTAAVLASSDPTVHHGFFRNLIEHLVEAGTAPDWMKESYHSADAFIEHFPDHDERAEWLRKTLEEENQRNVDDMNKILDGLMENGFSYRDLEEMRYEFPSPEEGNDLPAF